MKDTNITKEDDDDMGIVMWTGCKICNEQIKPLSMSLPTYKYSFGKYLELLLYDKDFMPPTTMCPHVTERQSILDVSSTRESLFNSTMRTLNCLRCVFRVCKSFYLKKNRWKVRRITKVQWANNLMSEMWL